MTEPLLTIHLEGPQVERGRILLKDLVQLASEVQSAIFGIARVIAGESGRKKGALPKDVQQACSLELVSMEKGSVVLGWDLARRQTMIEGLDPGLRAVEALVLGCGELSRDGGELPFGFDEGVMEYVRQAGNVLDHGVTNMNFRFRVQERQADFNYNPAFRTRLIMRIQAPVSHRRSIEGRLLMADFKETGTRCRIHPPIGSPVNCTFSDDIADVVKEYLRAYVRVTGEASEDATGRIKHLVIRDIESIEMEDAVFKADTVSFWEARDIGLLAREQEVAAVSFTDVAGVGADLWDSDEDFAGWLEELEQGKAA